jgi:threonine dehydratase
MTWPLSFEDVARARDRIRPHLAITALFSYPLLDQAVGHGVRVLVKHENHQPIGAFKVRNALSAMTLLDERERRGVVAASRGNHGMGVAWAGRRLGVPVTICVPRGNNPDKNAGIHALGAELVEEGRDYDESLAVAEKLARDRGIQMMHSTNDARIIAGAGTITLEILEQEPAVDALLVAVGGGSQAVGAITVARALKPDMPVIGVQAEGAAAIHDGWHAKAPCSRAAASTFADGMATRECYEMTFAPLCEGLHDFITVSDAEIADAIRLLLATTHNLAEGAGAAGVAGLRRVAPRFANKTVAVVLSGGNIDHATLMRVLHGEL